jgi:uncharacterized protein YndB with AHSA1/START domain
VTTADARAGEPVVAEDAPVFSFAQVEIGAPIEVVWNVLTAIDRWPTWNPDVKSVSIDVPVERGSAFRWKAGPGTITSCIEHIDRPHVVAWSGRSLGIHAVHVWRLESRAGGTLARTEESYDGLVARLLRRSLQEMLDSSLVDGAGYLKAEAERTSAGSGSTSSA